MPTQSKDTVTVQSHLFKLLFRDMFFSYHAMVKLAQAINWQSFENAKVEFLKAKKKQAVRYGAPDLVTA